LFRDWFCHDLREQLAGAHVRFGSKADMCGAQADVRFVPKAGIGTSITSSGCEQGSRTIDGARA
jgi:hypothetical protein